MSSSGAKASAGPSPVQYRQSGVEGHSSSTIAGKVSALVHFNDFLATKQMKKFEELSESELCSIPLFREFGTYLSEQARKKNKVRRLHYTVLMLTIPTDVAILNVQGADLLKWGTAKQFISGPKTDAQNKFKDNVIWVHQDWYYKIRRDIEATIAKRCIELGIPVEDKSEAVGRELLLLLNEIMLSMEDQADQRQAINFRAAINMTFAAVGPAIYIYSYIQRY